MDNPPQLELDDPQVQSAFSSGDWPLAARLAGARFRSTKDQIYQIVKICAESQLDDPIAKFGALSSVWNYVDDKIVISVDGIDLLEWATRELADESDHVDTLGALRVRLVKAAPDENTGVSCLESCLLHWDLVSAQQIASILSKTFPKQRNFMFWAIEMTHLLATSSQVPEGKAKLYGTLAQRQIEKAAKLTEDNDATPQGVQTEAETLLLYVIVGKHGSPADLENVLRSSVYSPLQQLRHGRQDLIKILAELYVENRHWNALYRLFKDCLSIDQTVCSWTVWRPLISSTHRGDYAKKVHDLLLVFNSSEKPTCIRTFQLAEVAAAFVDASHSSLECLKGFIESQGNDLSCFEDIRSFVEMLEPPEMMQLVTNTMPKLAATLDTASAKLLALKLHYMVASRSTASKTCTICGGPVRRGCKACLAKISQAANELHRSLALEPEAQGDILPELSILIAYCRIKPCNLKSRSPATLRELLQALISLEVQRTKSPKHSQLSLLIVQLHTLLGSAHRARDVLDSVDGDSFAALFLDRLSTIAPSIITGSEALFHQVKSSESSAKGQFVDALQAGDHSNVLRLHKRIESSTSKSMSVVTLIEEARVSGMLGNPLSVLQDARHVSDDVQLATIDASLPSWDSSTSEKVHARLRVGQPPSDGRLHLALLSEGFRDVLTSPTTHADATDADAFVLGKMSQICNAVHKLMPSVSCTATELAHYQVIGLLSGLVPLGASLIASSTHTADFTALAGAADLALVNMRKMIPYREDGFLSDVTILASLHGISMFRESAASVRLAAKWLLDLNSREQQRSGKTIAAAALQLLNGLYTGAKAALTEARGLIQLNHLQHADFEDNFKDWLLRNDETAVAIAAVADLVSSWRANAEGWQEVQWHIDDTQS